MEAAPDEDSSVFMDSNGEIVENEIGEHEVHEEVVHNEDMIQVQHEEVLEEIVEEDGMMYDTDGRVIEYRDMMVYDEDTEVIEEYVEVEDLGDGRFAYVMTDEHGNRRLLKDEEVEAMKKMPHLMEEVLVDEKELEAGPSTSEEFPQHKRGRFPPRGASKQVRPRGLMGKDGHMLYVDRDEFYGSSSKRMNDMAKIDVEKYVPTMTINRRPLPDNFKPKPPRVRKNPPWQEESGAGPSTRPSTSALDGSTSPILKDSLLHEEEIVVRFKCPECGEGFPSMERHCLHMFKRHDCQTTVREADFFTDTEFENFLVKVEKASLGKEMNEVVRKKSRTGSSQIFVCNYMSKGSQKEAELVEVGMAALAERPLEVCTAFVQKTHSYESIHVKYCDQHIHFDGNIGFRVPLAVKRRLFQMSFKRIPIPCMQVLLSMEVMDLLPHPTRFEQKLRNLSHVEIVELLGIINASLRKHSHVYHEPRGRRIGIKFDSIKTSEGAPTLVVKRVDLPKSGGGFGRNSGPSTSSQPIGFDGQEIPEMEREEEVFDQDTVPEECDGVLDENFFYDPENDRDPLFEELTETELGVLEAYERDISVKLTEEQHKERIRQKTKFSLAKVVSTYQSLDTATHGLSAAELHTDTINQLREMASYVVEICCQLDAEVKSQFNPALRVDEIKRDMIAGIAMQERTYQPERRPRRIGGSSSQTTPNKPQFRPPARSHEEYSQRIMMSKQREMDSNSEVQRQLLNITEAFEDINQQQRLQILREETLKMSRHGSLEPEDEKPTVLAPVPEEMKAMPWVKPQRSRRPPADPNAPPKKRGRPHKKDQSRVVEETVVEEVVNDDQEMILVENPEITSSEAPPEPAAPIEPVKEKPSPQKSPVKKTVVETAKPPAVEIKEVKEEPPTPPQNPVPPTTTRTGRVVKPKKWDDHEQ
uniref:C2H2-type domain-containing protein n=1 Tax=Caenorhabditis tropicalis TaxID=1561998 RepID=A0A1I7TSG8_9PELO